MQPNDNTIPTAVIIINYYYIIICLSFCSEARQKTHRVVGRTPSCRRNKRSTRHDETVSHTYLLIQWLKYKNTNTRPDGTFCGTVTPLELDRLYLFFMIYDKYFAETYEIIFFTLTLQHVMGGCSAGEYTWYSIFVSKPWTLYNEVVLVFADEYPFCSTVHWENISWCFSHSSEDTSWTFKRKTVRIGSFKVQANSGRTGLFLSV